MPKAGTCLKVMRVFNIIVAYPHPSHRLLIVTAGVLGIISIAQYLVGAKFFLVFSPVFITLFGLLMLAAEFRIKFIIKNFIHDETVGVRDGDGFIHNDARYGGVHNTDQSMMASSVTFGA